MSNNQKINLLYIQILSSIGFIITISISIILTLNNIQKTSGNKPFFNIEKENTLSINNRLTITTIAIIFTYISYKFYTFNKNNISKQELFASILATISALILLNTTIKNAKKNNNSNDINIPII